MQTFKLRITGDIGFEFWQDIPGYEGYYEDSTYGRIRTVPRQIWNGRGYYTISPTIKNPSFNRGYLQIKFSKDNTDKMFQVHRIIALTFIPNFNKFPCINHKDENKSNNRVENLEWCTVDYNNKYNGRYDRVTKKISKRVQQIDKGIVIAEYPSCAEAARELKVHRCHIAECARGIRASYAGYEWKYV